MGFGRVRLFLVPLDFFQHRDAAGGDPLRDHDIASVVKAGVVRMDKASGSPFGWRSTHLKPVERLLTPLRIVTQLSHHLVGLIQQRDSAMQVRHDHQVTLGVDVRGEKESVQLTEKLAVHIEELQSLVSSVANGKFGLTVARIEPLSVGRLELTVSRTGAADGAEVLGILVVLVNQITAVTIAQEKTAIGREAGIGRPERHLFFVQTSLFLNDLEGLAPNPLTVEVDLGESVLIESW